jgi:hypothetical protein
MTMMTGGHESQWDWLAFEVVICLNPSQGGCTGDMLAHGPSLVICSPLFLFLVAYRIQMLLCIFFCLDWEIIRSKCCRCIPSQ